VVDDAFEFGKISATNALSDIYAMGGKPLTALAILGWPVDKLPSSVAARVLDGARFMCRMAGITLAGGHSIESAEPFFGLAVNGTIIKDHIKTNSGSQEGDLLFLTKPLGMGIITTAAKRGVVNKQDLDECVSYMSTLNKVGEELAKISGVRAMTDITGFGLAGHLIEMCEGSGLSAKINFENIPVFPCIGNYISQFIYPDMTMKNFSFFSSKMSELNSSQLLTLCDPQTSGGLLVSVSPQFVDEYLEIIRRHNLFEIAGRPIGTMVSREDKLVFLD